LVCVELDVLACDQCENGIRVVRDALLDLLLEVLEEAALMLD
jgi:hypothetical protein